MDREKIEINKKNWSDFTAKDVWLLNNENYVFIEDYPSRDCDGECHNVIVQRESDKKFFSYQWAYGDGNYYFEKQYLTEVFPTKITKIIYK
jgi:hypothetical protein